MHGEELSAAVQDYLKQIYELQEQDGRASTSKLAARLRVRPASASGMIKKLRALRLVGPDRRGGARLTPEGERAAIEVIRHHRLVEKYLVEKLGLPIDIVHAEADRLEHALSEQLEEWIDRDLGFPTHDPHGDPIPSAELQLDSAPSRRLSELRSGDRAIIRRVPDGDPALLRYLVRIGMVPGKWIIVTEVAPSEGPLTIRAGTSDHAVSLEAARRILVS